LRGLKDIKFLNLGGTQVTDAGIVQLKELTSLKTLRILDTQVTDAGVEDLKKALPQCDIISSERARSGSGSVSEDGDGDGAQQQLTFPGGNVSKPSKWRRHDQ
jgi:hypothetical protein